MGIVVSGVMCLGDEVVVLLIGKIIWIIVIDGLNGLVVEVFLLMVVLVWFVDDIDILCGDMIVCIYN